MQFCSLHLQIRDGGHILQKLCGYPEHMLPLGVTALSNSVAITFVTNGEVQGVGFKLIWSTSSTPGKLTAKEDFYCIYDHDLINLEKIL